MVNFSDDESSWVIDSGASSHLTPKKEYLSSYTSGDYGYVKMGNDGSCRIVGMGNVCLMTFIGCRMVLRDVRHVLDVRLNLIPLGRLDDVGYSSAFQNGVWKFCKGSLIVVSTQKQNIRYMRCKQNCVDKKQMWWAT